MYFVTRHEGQSAGNGGAVLLASAIEAEAWCFYSSIRPIPGTTVAMWRPDGSLLASKVGHRLQR